jgi:predicted RNA binding protein YcfA (HicA-like mRNA interferase family)
VFCRGADTLKGGHRTRAECQNENGWFGFHRSRTSGSHRIFSRPGIPELVNLQEVRGEAKPYQIRQFLKIVERYNLRLMDKP